MDIHGFRPLFMSPQDSRPRCDTSSAPRRHLFQTYNSETILQEPPLSVCGELGINLSLGSIPRRHLSTSQTPTQPHKSGCQQGGLAAGCQPPETGAAFFLGGFAVCLALRGRQLRAATGGSTAASGVQPRPLRPTTAGAGAGGEPRGRCGR